MKGKPAEDRIRWTVEMTIVTLARKRRRTVYFVVNVQQARILVYVQVLCTYVNVQ